MSTSSGHRPPPRWHQVAAAAGLLDADGGVRATVFAEMSALAARTGALNLGQGFPDVDGPSAVARAAADAILAGHNQYPPGTGIPALRAAVAAHQAARYGIGLDPDSQVLVTTGATEGLAAAVLALAGPGDEVLTLEPFYDSYAAVVAMAGARHTTVPLRPAPDGFRLDADALTAAVTPRTRLLLLNSPHNPTGAVLRRDELEAVARVAVAHDLTVVTDEVYEHLVFGVEHVPVATLPGMAERTLTVSSSGKTFSFTGWKIGWVTGPAALVTAVRTVKQFLTYVSGAPFQPAVAAALTDPAALAWVDELVVSLAERRDLLAAGLREAGFDVVRPDGTYFVLADAAPLGYGDGVALCRELPALAGVVGVPVRAFTRPGSVAHHALGSYVRFTFVKRREVLEEAVTRLARLRGVR
ncbi:pyridoxal phosphate-dependent aminotransferase [Cellulomonas shaoxiangyii]|uniref:Pyridoxal phosphate-dependent aminotransferase n=1 Tax=Cellulomonas shaoxiangyii TaxID=2566013 RepID=A0A4P7SM69_9CELL|nr:pyridoxal phosphate-dependent aminotransferase [Cellulomonas shaoxiangyii]QCB94306.1 pyridoxal phosphate-dependent aminotransferase [Cellulomonas shaoxiangyii]TGY84529.1 pyridoxal phosphate-dependent aminotransferase [Cellulomonas shaoxiangyii]